MIKVEELRKEQEEIWSVKNLTFNYIKDIDKKLQAVIQNSETKWTVYELRDCKYDVMLSVKKELKDNGYIVTDSVREFHGSPYYVLKIMW